jgi:hypothetical protein
VKKWSCFSLLLLLSSLLSCGYRWEPDYSHATRPTLNIPFISGDEDGFLTHAITKALGASGLVEIVSSDGDYQLQVLLLDNQSDKIGFRIDPQKIDGKVKKRLLAAEGRKTIIVEATFLKNEKPIYGPYKITADADYDYVDGDSLQDLTFITTKGQVETVLPFSLGQLEPWESAQEAARSPLFESLGQKMVDLVASLW